MKIRALVTRASDFTVIALFIYLLIFPQYATKPTADALTFCAKTLIPSLFIYMVLSKIIIGLPVTDRLTRLLGIEAVALITGTLCGCPIGAKNAVSLYESGRISKKHAEYLCAFTNNASVSFVIGYVGSELFGDIRVGIKLFLLQLASSVITAVVLKYVMFGKSRLDKTLANKSIRTGLREAVTDSAATMINLCACAVFFIVVGGVLSGLLDLNATSDAAVKSLLEFSSGCAAGASLARYSIPVTAFAIGQTGFSVALQVRSVTANKLSIKPYLIGKTVNCAVMTSLAVICG